jgi:hypothetical protein
MSYLAERAVEAEYGLAAMNLGFEDRIRPNVNVLASALPCHAGICPRKETLP